MVCSMSKARSPAAISAIASDPELVRLERQMRELYEQAESRMADARALSKEPVNLVDTADRFLAISDDVIRLITQNEKLRKRYERRREKLEAERARRVASARAAFLMAEDDSPHGATRH